MHSVCMCILTHQCNMVIIDVWSTGTALYHQSKLLRGESTAGTLRASGTQKVCSYVSQPLALHSTLPDNHSRAVLRQTTRRDWWNSEWLHGRAVEKYLCTWTYSECVFSTCEVGWSPNHVAEDEPHPQEVVGRLIQPCKDGYWEVWVVCVCVCVCVFHKSFLFSFSCSESPFKVFAAPLKHRVMCFGYVIMEDPLPGK